MPSETSNITTESNEPPARWVIDLEEEGDGGFYRVENLPGEINRTHVVDQGKKFHVIADLVEVVYGTLRPAQTKKDNEDLVDDKCGQPGALIVMDFQLVPKRDRRFNGAILQVTFAVDGGGSDPGDIIVSVDSIAPSGNWAMCPTTRGDSSSWTLSPTVQLPSGAGGSLGDRKGAHTQTKTFHTSVEGSMRMTARQSGGKDTAQWVLSENTAQNTGVARWLRAAMVVRMDRLPEADGDPQTVEALTEEQLQGFQFNATVEVITSTPKMSLSRLDSMAETVVQWLKKKTPPNHPVVFRYAKNKRSGQLVTVKKTDLLNGAGEGLDGIMNMGLHKDYDESKKKARQL